MDCVFCGVVIPRVSLTFVFLRENLKKVRGGCPMLFLFLSPPSCGNHHLPVFFFCFQDGPAECKECQKAPKFICSGCGRVNLCECVSCGKSYVYDEKQGTFRGSKQVQGCMCSDPRFFRSVLPLKCSCHLWSYLEPGTSCLLCAKTYKRVGDHAGHFETQHSDIAKKENEKQLKKMIKRGDDLKKLCNETNRLQVRLYDATFYDASRPVSGARKNLLNARKNLLRMSKHMDDELADHKKDTDKHKMRMANRSLMWNNIFLRAVPGELNPVCISCGYGGREYVAHLQSKQHLVQAYPLLVAEQRLQSLGRIPQTIIDIILEYSVDAPYSELAVTSTAGPPYKITLDELLPFLHQRSSKKRRKPFQGDQERARKYRKVSWHYVGAKPMKAKPMKAKLWCKKQKGETCYAFKMGGICLCGPDNASVAPKFSELSYVDYLRRDAPDRLAETTVHSNLPALSAFFVVGSSGDEFSDRDTFDWHISGMEKRGVKQTHNSSSSSSSMRVVTNLVESEDEEQLVNEKFC